LALQATIHRIQIALSDVDRSVYEALDLRVARHPSESMRYLLTRTLAYALSYEEGIAFSKGGLSDAEEAAVTVRDPTGRLLAWIDVGSPSAERLHKATKASPRVSIFTHSDLTLLRRDALAGKIHKAETVEVWRIDTALLDALEPKIERHTAFDLTRSDGRLYLTVGPSTLEGAVTASPLCP
jgi:uncharacterized protein YaeQ